MVATAMDHAQAHELFSAHFERELASDQASALEEHLKECASCRQELEEFERTMQALSSMHKMVAPTEFVDGVRTRIHKKSRGRFFSPKKMAERVPFETFSIVMLGLILGLYILLQMVQPSQLKLP
jgi:predicted anti-sigma-YlaC factor YlaD